MRISQAAGKQTSTAHRYPTDDRTVFFPRITDLFEQQYNIPIQLFEYGSIRARTLLDAEQIDVAVVNMDFYNLDKYTTM